MPRMDSTGNTKEKIGVVKVKNVGVVDISYIGGSMFEMNFEDSDRPPVKLDVNTVNKLVQDQQLTLTSKSRYNTILSNILPDGSTQTHNKDGSMKSKVAQTLDGLAAEGIVQKDNQGKFTAKSSNESDKRTKQVPKPSRSGTLDETPKQASHKPTPVPFTRSVQDLDENLDEDPFADMDEPNNHDGGFFDEAENEVDEHADAFESRQTTSKLNPTRSAMSSSPETQQRSGEEGQEKFRDKKNNKNTAGDRHGDLNGDGIVDEMDKFVAEEQAKSPLLMLVLGISAVASIGLFFIAYFLSANLFGNEIDLPFGTNNEQVQNTQQTPGMQQENANNGSVSSTSEQSERTTVVRTDFDPETPVLSFPLADENKEKIAIGMFQAIRTAILSGDVAGFNAAVDLNRIAGELSQGYVNKATQVQGLNEAERNELAVEYQNTLATNERQHVVDRDTYGSIFGGRIREVRQDPNNPDCIYVVMEAIAGDHHRICFALNGNDSIGWTVTDALDVGGYMNMVAKGTS